MQWQLKLETTMHAFDINTLLTMNTINKLTEWTGNGHTFFFPQCKNDQCGSKNTHAPVPEKVTINFFWPKFFFLTSAMFPCLLQLLLATHCRTNNLTVYDFFLFGIYSIFFIKQKKYTRIKQEPANRQMMCH